MAKSKLLNLITRISEIAKREKWMAQYDKESDVLYWTKPRISRTARLKQFIDDFSLYITPSGKIEGLFLEYAKFNFNAHNEGYDPLFKAMTQKIDDTILTIPKKREKEVNYLLDNMADKVAKETLHAINEGLKIEEVLKV